ncbi:MAG: helicase domain-containing protein [Halomonadaceae bacterium T82-2]|nr:MAG: helicase domain-containing protein [Halomonadaceae bacterium T82-2]
MAEKMEGRTPNAWMAVDQGAITDPRLSPFTLRVTASGELLRGVCDGDWLLIVGPTALVTRVGRVLKANHKADATTYYLDRVKPIEQPVSLGSLGLPPCSSSIGRLEWTKFAEAVSKGLGFSLAEVPLVAPERPEHKPHAHAYIRELLQLAVVDDLLGPAGGPEELIKDMSVQDRYLVGKLAPRKPADGDTATVEPAAGMDEDDEPVEPQDASLHQPGQDFSKVTGRVDPDDDALDEIDTTDNQSLVPSSIGMTFCVAPDVDSVEVTASWGRYEKVPGREHDFTRTRKNKETGEEEQIKIKVWKRVPCGGSVRLPLVDGSITPKAPSRSDDQVRLQGTIRTNGKGERLVTLFLVNGQEEPKQNKDAAWVFQPEIRVAAVDAADGKAIFHRRPGSDSVDDEERERLALVYRRKLEFAVGHGVSVHATTSDTEPTLATEVRTQVMPHYEIPVTETPGSSPEDRPAQRHMIERGWLDMKELAAMEVEELREALTTLTEDYAAWIGEQENRIGDEITVHEEAAKSILGDCRSILGRLREGVSTLAEDPKALKAFRFANQAMADQRIRSIYSLQKRRGADPSLETLHEERKNFSWRPFQLAFLLLSIPSLANPHHQDRTHPVEAHADLLWFPTGGGKTEAYLGVAAFAMGIRRLMGMQNGLDGSRGLTVIMRYTLRLLTLQQFQRATALICAMEVIRRSESAVWGEEPFTIGLWVGNKVTPGTTAKAHEAIEATRNDDRNTSSLASPAQLTGCPWCGSEIAPGRDIKVDKTALRTTLYCSDPYGRCEFSEGQSSRLAHPGLPVKVVDEEIYHRPPSMMIATVDKFAQMAWRPEVRALFGRVDRECERHGLLWPGHDCGQRHRRQGMHPASKVKTVPAIRPPDLIIQDEFHLISGPLGTMVGLYETAVDELCSWHDGDTKIRPKVVASTATVRKAADQVRNVFMRRLAVFPPSGLDVEDNYFSVQRPTEEISGRRYLGICAPGSSRPAVLIRTYTAFLTAAQALFDHFGKAADPYMTLVGYFNSLRELGGMKRLAEDDVNTRCYRVAMSLVERPGLAQRRKIDVVELTSRVRNDEIPKYLDQMEIGFQGRYDDQAGKWIVDYGERDHRALDVVLATNMLSVGVDVNRLGLMVVNGQPKGTAEYIQATSRVGRAFPGLVASVLTWSKPRDLSHYETYEHYHATFYQHVEAQSVTPFSPRAMDRGLTGTFVSLLRNEYEAFGANEGADELDRPDRGEVRNATGRIVDRASNVTESKEKRQWTMDQLKSRADDWAKEASLGGRTLVYQKMGKSSDTSVDLLKKPGADPWSKWTVPMSMREVEPGVGIVMDDAWMRDAPDWQVRPAASTEEGEES